MINLKELIDLKTLTYNWDKIVEIPEFARLKECEQNPRWHGEGNVWNHTVAVCNEAIKYCQKMEWGDNDYTEILLTSALFHDIGKGVTTALGKDGNWHSYNHESKGEIITRYLLWDCELSFREEICAMVKNHMMPLTLMSHKHNFYENLIMLAKSVNNIYLLGILKKCDILGSTQIDNMGKNIDLNMVDELLSISRILSLYRVKALPNVGHFPAQIEKECLTKKPVTVNVMIGLAGAGKSTWISKHSKKNDAIISRDKIRVELGFCTEDEKIIGTSEQESAVTAEFNRQILEAAETGKTIFIDNLNIKKKYRDGYKNLLKDYSVRWNYVYIETSFANNVSRREGQISEHILKDMIKSIDWPTPDEYDSFKQYKNE